MKKPNMSVSAVAVAALLMAGAPVALTQGQSQQAQQQRPNQGQGTYQGQGQRQGMQRERDQGQQNPQTEQQQGSPSCSVCAAKKASGGDVAAVEQAIADWPQTPKEVAQKMMEKYGPPSGVTPSRLIWNDPQRGPWAEIILSRDEVQHDFPMKHTDVLEQAVYFDVPSDKVDDLARYDGSVIVERTKGTLSARCDKEAANFLALNLAHDIITDKKTVEEARQAYADAIKQMMQGRPPETMQRLMFEPKSKRQAAFTDEVVIQKR